MKNPNNEPERVRLTEDYLDFPAEVAHKEGAILIRSSSGQYISPETKLGQGNAVAMFSLISDICEAVEA